MLELQGMRLVRRAAPGEPDARGTEWTVNSLDDQVMLGLVREMRGLGWLECGLRRFEVCETEDAALLMSIEHGWFSLGRWQVRDAERRRVGTVIGNHLLDDQRSGFATIRQENAGASVIRDRQGRELARLESEVNGAQTLRFADDLEANPFLRMVLLAGAVVTLRETISSSG